MPLNSTGAAPPPSAHLRGWAYPAEADGAGSKRDKIETMTARCLPGFHRPHNAETPPERGFRHAAEWSRTITGVSTHKALNCVLRRPLVGIWLSRAMPCDAGSLSFSQIGPTLGPRRLTAASERFAKRKRLGPPLLLRGWRLRRQRDEVRGSGRIFRRVLRRQRTLFDGTTARAPAVSSLIAPLTHLPLPPLFAGGTKGTSFAGAGGFVGVFWALNAPS
jgi:hypothetical protein